MFQPEIFTFVHKKSACLKKSAWQPGCQAATYSAPLFDVMTYFGIKPVQTSNDSRRQMSCSWNGSGERVWSNDTFSFFLRENVFARLLVATVHSSVNVSLACDNCIKKYLVK